MDVHSRMLGQGFSNFLFIEGNSGSSVFLIRLKKLNSSTAYRAAAVRFRESW